MTRYTPLWEQAGSYAASVDRRLIGALWPSAAVYGCVVTVAAGTMNMNIAAGTVVAPAANNTGSVLCYTDAVEVVTSPAAPGAGTNRYDVVVCQPRGNDLDGGANNDFIFTVVSGTASASPTVPATPAGAVALAQVLVIGASASLSSANLADRRYGGLATPGGLLAYAERTTDAGPVGSATQIVGLSVTVNVPANRRIELSAWCRAVTGNTVSTTCEVQIREAAVVIRTGLAIIENVYGAFSSSALSVLRTFTPTAGTHTYDLWLVPGSANNSTMQGNATYPSFLRVTDLGPV